MAGGRLVIAVLTEIEIRVQVFPHCIAGPSRRQLADLLPPCWRCRCSPRRDPRRRWVRQRHPSPRTFTPSRWATRGSPSSSGTRTSSPSGRARRESCGKNTSWRRMEIKYAQPLSSLTAPPTTAWPNRTWPSRSWAGRSRTSPTPREPTENSNWWS